MNAEGFLALPQDLRGALFQRAFEAQSGAGVVPSLVIIEKDFWVCWILHQLFYPAPIVDGLVFKGGTSLSKAYDAIQRFSEDVDLTVPTPGVVEGVAINDSTPEHERRHLAQRMQAQVSEWCRDGFCPLLEARLQNAFSSTPLMDEWQLECDALQLDNLRFHYPRSLPEAAYTQASGVKGYILLEVGARNPVTPSEPREISPICRHEMADHVSGLVFSVIVLHGKRTFWEKVTILHELHGRPSNRKRSQNYSRHFSDVAVLSAHDLGTQALKELPLLRTVARDKHRLFYEDHADYLAAARGEVTLVPHASELERLRADYESLSEMAYAGARMTFDEALERVRRLEETIRARAVEIADD